jgi:ribosome-binding factor A
MMVLLKFPARKSFKFEKLNGTFCIEVATILSELKIKFKNGISIRNEKIEKIVEKRLNTTFKTTFGMYGLQYFSKLRKSSIEVAKILFTFVFMETIRQRQVAKTIQVVMSDIVQKELTNILDGAMVTISGVRVTPDLYTARIYVSIYNHKNPESVLDNLDKNNKFIRGLLGKQLRNKVRSIPQLEFFKDDTLEDVQNLERIFGEIKKKDAELEKLRNEGKSD